MSQDLKALLLDFDGTLADSIGVMWDIYLRYLKEFGKEGGKEEFDTLNGPPLPEIVRILKETHNLPGTVNELLARYEEIIDVDYAKAGAMPGAQEIIAVAKEKKMKVGIVTSGKENWVKAWLKRNELKVNFIIDRNSAPRGKPSPDPYFAALRMADCAAAQAWAVEDSATGAKAALGAGIHTFTIGLRVDGAQSIKNLQDVIDALRAA